MIVAAAILAAALWTPHPADGVEMHLTREGEVNRLDFDFHGHGGYAIARRDVSLELPPSNYQFTFRIRGDAPVENLEFKLTHGDDVWWLNRRDFAFPRDWTTLATKKRQISFAWGPAGGGEPRYLDAMEVVVTAGSGGKGTVWFTDPELEPLPPTPTEPVRFNSASIDFGAEREVGGLVIEWEKEPRAFNVFIDSAPHPDALPAGRRAGTAWVWLPDTEARSIRIEGGAVRSIIVQPPTWAPTANDFYSIVAKAARRGEYPRYFLGEQSYWTVVGADGADSEALVGEDGAVEPFKSGESIEPFLLAGGKRLTWADVTIAQSLAEGDLPIPSVTWKTNGGASMTMKAAVSSSSMLQLRYRVRGNAQVELQVRPFQVNPSTQFLNTEGGVTRVSHRDALAYVARTTSSRDFEVDIPLERGAKREPFEKIASDWREKLHRVAIDIAGAPEIGDTIRANLAYTLIHRDGPALQPGSRSYERAWIRDGALLSSLLLRLGHADVAKQFAQWFASHQYENGKVPCCVDKRGADPVPENDSHGELIFLVAEIDRYTHDHAFVKKLQPHVEAAARYINELRAQNDGEFEGLVTESISHEGYSAKPVHSYWDDFFALRGLQDAEALAVSLSPSAPLGTGSGGEGPSDMQRGRSFASLGMTEDLSRSIRRTIDAHHLDYVPASVELADFDPTSTAIGISPLGLLSLFPERELRRTYEKYFTAIAQPRADYTPYEMRIIGALIRLGERNRALQLVDRFMLDRRPSGWKQWAEVVRTEYRKAGFVGDMPHAWIASDFTRSILDAIAYEREDGTLVIGAGVPKRWLPLHVGPLPTSQGVIDVRIDRDGRVAVKGAKNFVIASALTAK
jgi:hypothetical protein